MIRINVFVFGICFAIISNQYLCFKQPDNNNGPVKVPKRNLDPTQLFYSTIDFKKFLKSSELAFQVLTSFNNTPTLNGVNNLSFFLTPSCLPLFFASSTAREGFRDVKCC